MRPVLRWAAIGLVVAACVTRRPSEEFECTTTADCRDGRQCASGYCVRTSPCPTGCTTCDVAAMRCDIACTSAASCPAVIDCPPGWACTITCTGGFACGDIHCDSGSRCAITCSGLDACEDIDCKDACACDVACGAGECQSLKCLSFGNTECTTDGTSSGSCDSTRAPGCNRC